MTDQITTKPFASQAQAGWAFATHQPFAKRWARQTGPYKKLPIKLKAANYHARAGQTIAGRLRRGSSGKFESTGAASSPSKRVPFKQLPKGATPKRSGGKGKGRAAKPKPTPEQRQQQHAAERAKRVADNRQSVIDAMAQADAGLPPAAAKALLSFADGQEDPKFTDGLIQAGLMERARDGTPRLTATGRSAVTAMDRGDTRDALDAIGRGADRAAGQRDRAAAANDRQARRMSAALARATRAEPRPKPDLAQAFAVAQPPKKKKRTRRPPRIRKSHTSGGGTLGRQSQTTKAANPGDYLVVEDRTRPSTWHLHVKRNGTPDHRLMGAAWAALHGGYRGNTYQGPHKAEALAKLKKLYASEGMDVPAAKSFAVFKDARGQMRWLARTTTAFEDRDAEVISIEALDASAADAAPRGPLRFWHMGRPDPLSATAPWGPGVDLGWCDFAATEGRTLIESGTFKSEAIGRAVAARASELELSPGFFHAAGEPDASGVFHHIRIFERSLVPKWAGRASNPYTGLVVEKAMDQKKLDALRVLVPEATIKELLDEVATTEKAAEAEGVRYKEETPELTLVERFKAFLRSEQPAAVAEPPADVAPDPIAALKAQLDAVQAELTALKAVPPTLDIVEQQADGEMAPMGGEEETPIEDAGEMSADEFISAIGAMLDAKLGPLVEALGITTKLDGHMGELKSLLSGFTTQKDDERAALTARLDQTDAKLAELSGDLPRAGYRASQSPDSIVGALAETLKDAPDAAEQLPFADQLGHWFPTLAAPR